MKPLVRMRTQHDHVDMMLAHDPQHMLKQLASLH